MRIKKFLCILLAFLIIFNFIFVNKAYCDNNPYDTGGSTAARDSGLMDSLDPNSSIGSSLIEGGTVESKTGAGDRVAAAAGNFGISVIGFITGIFARVIDVLIAFQVDLLLLYLGYAEYETTEGLKSEDSSAKDYFLTMDKLVYNRVPLVNINYFDIPSKGEESSATYQVDKLVLRQNPTNIAVKRQVAKVYNISRLVAIALSLLTLIYIGIRMAISTVASDQAKYKKMLIGWIESIFLLAIMLYIMAAIIIFSNSLTNMFFRIRNNLFGTSITGFTGKYGVFEDEIRGEVSDLVFSLSGLQVTFWSFLYWFMLYMVGKFFWTYAKRFLMTGFLIAISPYIIVSYSIDKAGDGRAQAFSKWVKEFLVNVLIQPLHAILYLIFVFSANAIASEAPIVGIAFMFAMTQGERMVKRVFNIEGLTSIRGVDHFGRKG